MNFNWISKLPEIITNWTKTEPVGALVVLLTIAAAAAKFIAVIIDLRRKRRADRASALAERSEALQSFSERNIEDATRHFVEQNCSNLDPAVELELRSSIGVQESVIKVIERELTAGQSRHLLILADSGMGKTTLLLNLVNRDLKRSKGKFGAVIVSLASEDAMERISSIRAKNQKTLFLDALDEDTHAIADHVSRLEELMKVSRDFLAVVLTCRSQFFAREEEIPREAGVLRIGPRPAGQDQAMTFRKIYVLPYSREQIRQYLKSVTPWWRLKQRTRAEFLIAHMHDLAARPMLLALVPELAQAKFEVSEVFHLYNFMVEAWFRRERSWVDRDTLRTASKLLAVDMYSRRIERGSESLPREELSFVTRSLPSSIQRWKLETRSLLNRDPSGALKFAHRSIMEYFFVLAAIEGDASTINTDWTDQMREFLFSWGRAARDTEKDPLVLRIFPNRAVAMGLLPLPIQDRSDEISSSALVDCLKTLSHTADRRSLPKTWRKHTVRCQFHVACTEVYDVADGTYWSVPAPQTRTNDLKQRSYVNFDELVYGNSPNGKTDSGANPYIGPYQESTNNASAEQRLTTLPQFLRLIRSLSATGQLWKAIGKHELYWLRSETRKQWFMVSVAPDSDTEKALAIPGSLATRAISHSHDFDGTRLLITIYASSSRNEHALLIQVCDTCPTPLANFFC